MASTRNIPKSKSAAARDAPPGRGRPRAFCAEKALDAAVKVFWRKGYEGTTLPDLERAMGINRPSLYAAFGNKASLFQKVIERYGDGPACFIRDAVEARAARQVFERVLAGAVAMLTDPKNPGGCLMVHGALACGDESAGARNQLAAVRADGERLLRKRFERARAEGDLPAGMSPADLARYVSAVTHGIAVLGVGGAKRQELRRVAELALRAWPQQ